MGYRINTPELRLARHDRVIAEQQRILADPNLDPVRRRLHQQKLARVQATRHGLADQVVALENERRDERRRARELADQVGDLEQDRRELADQVEGLDQVQAIEHETESD